MNGTITKHTTKKKGTSYGYVFDAGRKPDGKRNQIVRKGFATKREAQQALREAIGDREKGVALKTDPRTFGSFFEDWLSGHGAAHWGKKTMETNRQRASYAIRMFGDVPLQKLSAMRIEQDLLTLLASGGQKTAQYPNGRPLSPKTVNEVSALVTQALEKAVKWDLIKRNPMLDVERPPSHKKEVEIPEPDEFEKFLDRIQNTRYFAFGVFCAAAGCRRGEALALEWSDVDLRTGVVSISKSVSQTRDGLEVKVTKSRRTRFVRVSRTTIQVLMEHKMRLETEKDLYGPDYRENNLVFPTPDGHYYMPDQVTGRISEFMRKAGIKASLHSLRHLHASLMLSKHVPITVVSKRLGHANSQITLDVYSHALKNDEAAAAEVWDDATSDIITRTRSKSLRKAEEGTADVIFCDLKPPKKAVNN